jgi:hypothetical protein
MAIAPDATKRFTPSRTPLAAFDAPGEEFEMQWLHRSGHAFVSETAM